MINTLLNGSNLPVLEKLAAFSERRQEVLAGNIANIDTPNYRMRDLPVEDFQAALSAAIKQASSSTSESTSSTTIDDLFPAELFQARQAPAANVTFQDGNNRSVEREVMAMTQNSMMQTFAIEVMASQMSLLESIIAERP